MYSEKQLLFQRLPQRAADSDDNKHHADYKERRQRVERPQEHTCPEGYLHEEFDKHGKPAEEDHCAAVDEQVAA